MRAMSVTLRERDVTSVLQCVHPRKASGPDGLKGRVLKECASQLGPIFTQLFQLFLNTRFVPQAWKMATIIPVPKITRPNSLNDFRPIAVTSVISKCFEYLVCRKLKWQMSGLMAPMQFAYKADRSVEDATLTLLERVHSHLDKAKTYARVLFNGLLLCIQYCSAPPSPRTLKGPGCQW